MTTEKLIITGIQSLGFQIEKIERGDTKTPDFLIDDGDKKYLMELKTKLTDQGFLEERKATLQKGEIFDEITPIERRNRISAIIRSAAVQLLEFKEADIDYYLICLFASGHNPEVQMDLFEASLYGSRDIADLSDDSPVLTGYFCDNSDFFNHCNIIDGAIITTSETGKFCLNQLSEKYTDLRQSELCKAFQIGVCDPPLKEKEGKAFIVDSDVDRKDEAAVLKYLQYKYEKPRLTFMKMQHMSGTMLIKKEDGT